MKRMLLLNAGAKTGGATQAILATVEREIGSEYAAQTICLGDMGIGYCKGCKACYDTCRCAIRDGMDEVIGAMNAADAVVVCAPSYWGDVPGQFKVFIDRCTVFSNTSPNPGRKSPVAGKPFYGIALRTGMSPAECEHIIECIAHWCGHMEAHLAGSMILCGIETKADIAKHGSLIAEGWAQWFGGRRG